MSRLYTQIGDSAKVVTGASEQSLMGSTPNTDYVGKKNVEDPRVGDTFEMQMAFKGVSDAGPGTNAVLAYAGGTCFAAPTPFDLENDNGAEMIIRAEVVKKDGQTLTLRPTAISWSNEIPIQTPLADVEVSTTTVGDAEYLVLGLTNQCATGRGVEVRRLVIDC